MPTAAKLVAALFFAVVAFLAAEEFKPLMPPHTQFGRFTLLCAAIGLFTGWRVMGSRAGRGWTTALGVGLTTSAMMTLAALFLFSFRETVLRSMNRRYDGPLDATVGTFGIMVEHLAFMGDAQLIGILVAGGLLGGLAAEAAGRRWG
jgi:hypothetical protein